LNSLEAHYGLRSTNALPLAVSKGSELCPCVTNHLPSTLRKPLVARHHISIFASSLLVPVLPLRLEQKATSSPAVMLRLSISRPMGPWNDENHTDSLERRHEGRAFIQHGQNRVAGLGRKHQDDPINAGVTVAF